MRRIVGSTLLLGCLAATSCKSQDEAPKPTASATAVAGRVLEVSGTVTVNNKPLAKGDTVTASDVVDTGPDGNVAIELAHNQVRWELGPNKHMRVDASIAWKEPKKVEGAQVVEDTTSAGRHAERTSADTVANNSADRKDSERARNDDKQAEATAADSTVAAPGGGTAEVSGTGGLGVSGTGAGRGGAGQGGGLGKIGTLGKGAGTGTGTGFGAGNGKLGGGGSQGAAQVRAGDSQVQGSIDQAVVARIVRSRLGQFRLCYEQGLKKDPTLAGKVVVTFVIDKTGAVVSSTAASTTIADPSVVSCIVAGFKRLTFPTLPDIATVNYPLVFAPPN